MKWSSSFPTWVVFLSSRPPLACPRCGVKVNKTPKYSVKHGRPLPCGRSLQCLLGNYGNNSAVRGEARGPRDDEVGPESMGRAAEKAGWQGFKVARAGFSRRYPINPRCHIRGRWMYVDVPSDLSSSTIEMLMKDDDKCLSSSVICASLTDRRLSAWSVSRFIMRLCLDCQAVKTRDDYSWWDILLQWKVLLFLGGLGSLQCLYNFYFLVRDGQNIEKSRGQNDLVDSDSLWVTWSLRINFSELFYCADCNLLYDE